MKRFILNYISCKLCITQFNQFSYQLKRDLYLYDTTSLTVATLDQRFGKWMDDWAAGAVLWRDAGIRSSCDSGSAFLEKHLAAACRSGWGYTWGGGTRVAPPTILLIG